MPAGWGWRPHDTKYKSTRRLAASLAEVTARGGNLLLNVSPKGDGSLPDEQVARLKQLGAWIATYGESVIGVQPAPPEVQFYGPAAVSADGATLYLHLLARPTEALVVRGVPVRRVRSVRMVGSDLELSYDTTLEVFLGLRNRDADNILGELRVELPAPTASLHDVVAVEFDAPLPGVLQAP
jgi:alpha-L-fucosidase